MRLSYTLAFDGRTILVHNLDRVDGWEAKRLDVRLTAIYGSVWTNAHTRFISQSLNIHQTPQEVVNRMHRVDPIRFPRYSFPEGATFE